MEGLAARMAPANCDNVNVAPMPAAGSGTLTTVEVGNQTKESSQHVDKSNSEEGSFSEVMTLSPKVIANASGKIQALRKSRDKRQYKLGNQNVKVTQEAKNDTNSIFDFGFVI